MEKWLENRYAHAEALRQRSDKTGSPIDAMEWERYTVQTVRMQSTAEGLRTGLGEVFRIGTGLRVSYKGAEVYLEHLVVGPTGVYLIESPDLDQETWRRDLSRNVAFLRESLGANARFFACLVIPRGPVADLPDGVHQADSLEVAIAAIQKGVGEQMPISVAREVWNLLQALALKQPEAQRSTYWQRWGVLEWAALAIAMVYNIIIMSYGDGFVPLYYLAGIFLFVGPMALVVGLVLLIPSQKWRKGITWAIVGLEIGILLLSLLGMMVGE